jgi:hypothetical protein
MRVSTESTPNSCASNRPRTTATYSATDGVYRLDDQLLVVLDIDEVLDLRAEAAVA